MSITRVFPIFAAAFAVIYVICVEANWALVTYHPRVNEWEWLTKPTKSGPPMYWYGWLATSFLAASAISLLALPLTRRWPPPVWIGWAVPLAVMCAFVYLLRSFFLRW
jgi:hypothetical protein